MAYNDTMVNIALGLSPNLRGVNKFGRNKNVDLDIDCDVWDLDTQRIWTAPTQARTHAIVSTSANDTISGSAARKIKVYGLVSWNHYEVSEVVELNGITPVNTVNEFVIIHRMKIVENGGTINDGIITATASTDGTVTAQIIANEGQTQMAIYGIPRGVDVLMTNYYASSIKAAASLSVELKLLVNTTPDEQLGAFLVKHTVGTPTEGTSYIEHHFSPYFKITGPAIIKIQANSTRDDTDVSAGFDLIKVL